MISGPHGDAALPTALRRGEVGVVLALSGVPAAQLSIALPVFLLSPLPLAFTLPGAVPLFIGVGFALAAEERLHRAVNAYNARVARDGSCPQRPAPPPPPPPWPGPSHRSPPRVAEPEDPLHPRYGPPPLPP